MNEQSGVALVGYGCRAPGGIRSADDLWRVAERGDDVLSRTSSNVGATHQERVSSYGTLRETNRFARKYFGYSPKDAREIDPQQRLLLECAVEAVENGGVGNLLHEYELGAFLSSGSNFSAEADGALSASIGADPQYAATRVAFKLGLEGPAFSVGSACSSSLVAVHVAAQSVLSGECDFALAGGMDIESPQPSSYLYQPDGILSRSGRVRPFDEKADGTVFGSGGGVVLLADLDLAIRLGLPIRSVISATAVNNDGADKASFTGPRTSRQASVISTAMANAGVAPDDIVYLETHGTATAVGDQSELRAIATAFPKQSPARPLRLGALKANIGHTRVGAGVLGLIKTSEVLRRRIAPPLANLDTPSRALQASGFHAPRTTEPLPSGVISAGVSSFGFGGTNAHVVLTSAPPVPNGESSTTSSSSILKISAERPDLAIEYAELIERGLLEQGTSRVAAALESGHAARAYRIALGATSAGDGRIVAEGWASSRPVTLVLPGQASGVQQLAHELYEQDTIFAASFDAAWAAFSTELRSSYRPVDLLASAGGDLTMSERHGRDACAAFAIAATLSKRGLYADTLAGVSLGEYAAACAAGVLTLEDFARLVIARSRMLGAASVSGTLVASAALISTETAFPAIRYANGTTVYAVADAGSLASFAHIKPLEADQPYHSPMLEKVASELEVAAATFVHRPSGRFRSLVDSSGEPATWGAHWAAHLTCTIDLARLVQEDENPIIVDATPNGSATRGLVGDVVRLFDGSNDWFAALGRAWVRGVDVRVGPEHSIPMAVLPERPFDSETIETPHEKQSPAPVLERTERQTSISDWTYQPSWTRKRRSALSATAAGERWLVFADEGPVAEAVRDEAARTGAEATFVTSSAEPNRPGDVHAAPGDEASVAAAVDAVAASGPVDRILHLWSLASKDDDVDVESGIASVDAELEAGFYTLLWAVQALARAQGSHPLRLEIVSRGAHPFDENTPGAHPSRATLNGATFVVPQDFPFVRARSIDVSGLTDVAAAQEVAAELLSADEDVIVAFTENARWVRGFERERLAPVAAGQARRLKEGGVYLITGGLGGIGTTIASFLARNYRANLVLTSLDGAPTEAEVRAGEPADERDNPDLVRQRIRTIRELEALGATVLARASDAADLASTRQLLDEVDDRFGRLDGLVHAAGVFETQRAFRALDDTGREDCDRRIRPKVHATVILTHLLRERGMDFALMQSSLSSHLGGLGFYAYTAGNSFMDAYAERFRSDRFPSMSVNWDGWVFHERSTDSPSSVISPSFASPDFGVVAEIAIRPSEGAAIYEQLMDSVEPHQVLVSTADFPRRVREWVGRHTTRVATPPSRRAEGIEPSDGGRGLTAAEQTVSAIWSEVLGVQGLQPESNFFSLGGDSLIGVTLAYEMSKASGKVVSVISLFENPTLEAMARIYDNAGTLEAADV